MATENLTALRSSDEPDDSLGLLDRERDTLPSSSELTQRPSLDSEARAGLLHQSHSDLQVSRNVPGVNAWRQPVIHNAFFVPGKVPSLNDLLEARGAMAPVIRSIIMRRKPTKAKSRGHRFDLYNDIKQDWKQRTVAALGTPFVRVEACYFGYVIVEETLKRDPSNICSAAIKFIEDGLVEAGAISNDGWKQVLGIRMVCVHRPGRDPGVYVVMSDAKLDEYQLVAEYEDSFLSW